MNFLGRLTGVGGGVAFTRPGSPAAQAWLGMESGAGALLVVAGPLWRCVPGFEDFSPHFSRYQAAWLRERNPGLEPGALGQWALRPIT